MADSKLSFSCDSAAAHPFALRVPVFKKTAKVDQSTRDGQRAAVCRTLDFLLKHPEQALDIYMHVEQVGARLQQEAPEQQEEFFSEKYHRMWRIPPAWWHSWLLTLADGAIPKELLDLVFKKCPESMRRIGYYLTGVCGQDVLPKEMHHKLVAAKVFTKLVRDLGPVRMQTLLEHISEDGEVQWEACGPYYITWSDEGLAQSIVHISDLSSPVEVSRNAMFTKEWKCREPYADHAACVVHEPSQGKYSLATYFPQGVGPMAKQFDSNGAVLREVALKFKAQLAAQQAMLAKARVVETKDLPKQDQVVEKRKASLAKAKEAAKAKKAKLAIAMSDRPALLALPGTFAASQGPTPLALADDRAQDEEQEAKSDGEEGL